MNSGKAPQCLPTWRGHIETTKDALIIFEACFRGTLAHCFRRPHDRERSSLIVSGNVFVYEEATSGIKRWTDGIPWSPSRILTNFLIYRQLNNPFPPGEKKRATKRAQRPSRPGDPYASSSSKAVVPQDESHRFSPSSPAPSSVKLEDGVALDKDANRGLLGSLVDSYEFKENGLLKKTMTVVINNVHHHLVSYYSLEDAKHRLDTPRDDPTLKDLPLREELLNQPKFKFPNFDDAGDGTFDSIVDGTHSVYGYSLIGYDPPRQLSALATQGHAPHQDQSPVYYGSMTPYSTSSHNPASQTTYASLPSTPSGAFMNIPPTPTSFHGHGQLPALPPQHPTHSLPNPQGHQQPQQSSHQLSNGSQYSPNPPQQTSAQPLPYTPDHQIFANHTLPQRPTGVFDYLTHSNQSFNPGNEYFGSATTSMAPVNDNALMLPHPWHANLSSPAHSYTDRASPSSYSYRT